MTTSGSSDFTRTRDQIIARSGRLIGAFKAGETMGSQEVTDFSEALNAMVKRWSVTPGMHVWTTTEATLFPQASQASYALAVDGTDHCTSSYVAMALSAAAASAAVSLSVASTTGVTVGDYLGIVLASGSMQWTTVNAKTSTTLTPTAALTGAASSGAAVYTYTSKIVRPLKIVDWRRYTIASAIETSGTKPIARLDYMALPNKPQTGIVNQIFYDPQLGTGVLYLWSPPTTVTDLVKFTWHRPIMDFDSAADTPDFPQEWFDPIVYNLAVAMAPEYDVPRERMEGQFGIGTLAAIYLDGVAGFDREAEAFFMQPDMGQ